MCDLLAANPPKTKDEGLTFWPIKSSPMHFKSCMWNGHDIPSSPNCTWVLYNIYYNYQKKVN